MLTKEICKPAFEDVKKYGENNIPPLAIDIFKRLIEEHFNPQPLKFEDFKRNMYVWDNEYKAIGKVDEVLTNCNCERLHIRYSNGGEIVDYTKNRFYPIIIPNIGDKSEKHI